MTTMLLVSAVTMGLFGGVHCIVMCGGVVGVLCAGLPSCTRARPLAQLRYVLAYNAGRITSYAFAGALAGGFGALADSVDDLYGAQVALRLLAGLLMLGVGLSLAGAWRRFGAIERLTAPLWRRVEPLARRLLPVSSVRSALSLGLLWGFMPCGMVYAALGLAMVAGSAPAGALVMATFGLGTLPTLVAMGSFAALLARLTKRAWVRVGAGSAIALFGVLNLVTATAQASWLSPLTSAPLPCCATPR